MNPALARRCPHRVRNAAAWVTLWAALLPAPAALALQTEPLPMEPLFTLNPTDAADLSAQSRALPTADSELVMQASTAVLQDMGYAVTGGEPRFGLLTGHKKADVAGAGVAHAVAEAAVVTATVILSILTGEDIITDLPEQVEQQIYVSLLVTPDHTGAGTATRVRISLDRDMIYDTGESIPDHTELPLVYQEFFDRLSRAVFFEEEQI